MQTRQNVEKMAKSGDFFSSARGNAKLMINFFCLSKHLNVLECLPLCIYDYEDYFPCGS